MVLAWSCHARRQLVHELVQLGKARREVSQCVVLAANVHGDGVRVVSALQVGEAAKQAHEQRAFAAHFVRGISHAGVVDAYTHDAVGEVRAVLLHAVDDGDHLLVLHVVGVHGVGVPPTPMEDAVQHVPPAAAGDSAGVTFEGDDRDGSICEEDPGPLDGVRELGVPP